MSSLNSLSTRQRNAGTLYFVALLRQELGNRIRSARTAAGMTQRDLATAIHLKNATDVSRYERGETDVPSHRIDLIAQATGRPRSYFVRDPSEPEPTQPTDEALAEVRRELAEVQATLAEVLRLARRLTEPE